MALAMLIATLGRSNIKNLLQNADIAKFGKEFLWHTSCVPSVQTHPLTDFPQCFASEFCETFRIFRFIAKYRRLFAFNLTLLCQHPRGTQGMCTCRLQTCQTTQSVIIVTMPFCHRTLSAIGLSLWQIYCRLHLPKIQKGNHGVGKIATDRLSRILKKR